jgi:hypothetical protein
MADEIKISASLAMNKGGKTPSLSYVADQFDMSGTDYWLGTQTATTTTAALDKGNITQPGLMLLKNLDGTNYVELGGATFTVGNGVIRVNAGEWCLFRWRGTTPFILANTASCEVEYLILEA